MDRQDPLHTQWAFSLRDAAVLPLVGAEHPLRREGPRWLAWGSATALALGLLLFGASRWTGVMVNGAPPRRHDVRIVRLSDLGLPPSLARARAASARAVRAGPATVLPSVRRPEPVAQPAAPPVPFVSRRALTEESAAPPPPAAEAWGTALRDWRAAAAGDLLRAPKPSAIDVNRRASLLLAAIPDSLWRRAGLDTSRAARLTILRAFYDEDLRRALPSLLGEMGTRKATDFYNRQAELFGEYQLMK